MRSASDRLARRLARLEQMKSLAGSRRSSLRAILQDIWRDPLRLRAAQESNLNDGGDGRRSIEDEERAALTPATLATHLSRAAWLPAPHLNLLSASLVQLALSARRLIVTMPPRHGKSSLVSLWFPVWLLEHWPERRIILTSYEAGFASEWGRAVRNTIAEHELDLSVRLAADSKRVDRWRTTAGGGMTTAGVGVPLPGSVPTFSSPMTRSKTGRTLNPPPCGKRFGGGGPRPLIPVSSLEALAYWL